VNVYALLNMDEMTLHRKQRLRELISAKPYLGNQQAFAAAAGLSKGRVTQLLDPQDSFGELSAKRIAIKLELGDPRYFELGFTSDSAAPVKLAGLPSIAKNSSDLVIPQFDAGGGMGGGKLLLDDQPGVIKSWHVDHEWLRQNVRHHSGAQNLCIVTGFGPSMRPMFNPGDPLLVDRGVTVCETDAVYFFRVGKHGFIKTLQRIPTASGLVLRAKSKNPDYDPFDITADMDFAVLGKVLTVWKSEQF
jgi:hypothetical protein